MGWALKWRRWPSETLGIPWQLACPLGALLRREELGNTMKTWGAAPCVETLSRAVAAGREQAQLTGRSPAGPGQPAPVTSVPWSVSPGQGPGLAIGAARLCRPQGRSHCHCQGCRTHVTPEGGLRRCHPGLMCWYFRESSRRRGGKGRRTTELSVLPFIVGHRLGSFTGGPLTPSVPAPPLPQDPLGGRDLSARGGLPHPARPRAGDSRPHPAAQSSIPPSRPQNVSRAPLYKNQESSEV